MRSLLAAASPYLRLLATTVCGGLMAKQAAAASSGALDAATAAAKVTSARFFGEQILPVERDRP